MPLVEYDGSSDDSEDEYQTNNESPNSIDESVESECSDVANEEFSSALFKSLPDPKRNQQQEGIPDEKIAELDSIDDINPIAYSETSQNKPPGPSKIKPRKRVKITIPALAEFYNDDHLADEPPRKKLMPSKTGSGLFSVLPPPQNVTVKESNRKLIPTATTSVKKFVPHSVTSKKTPVPQKKKEVQQKSLVTVDSDEFSNSDNEDDNLVGNVNSNERTCDFFALTTKESEKACEGSAADVQALIQQKLAEKQRIKEAEAENEVQQPEAVESSSVENSVMPTELNNSEFFKMQGKKGRKMEEINIIDVDAASIMPDPNEWLMKQLTAEKPAGPSVKSMKSKMGPTSQQKRKHQITYLAFQAKERELELKNQWAENRMTRKQTQSKYGF